MVGMLPVHYEPEVMQLLHACRFSRNIRTHARLTSLLLSADAPWEMSAIRDRDVHDNRPDVFVV